MVRRAIDSLACASCLYGVEGAEGVRLTCLRFVLVGVCNKCEMKRRKDHDESPGNKKLGTFGCRVDLTSEDVNGLFAEWT